jgi:hypothetical protein
VNRSSPPHSYVVGYNLRWDTESNSQPQIVL